MFCAIGSKSFTQLKPVKRRGNRRYYQHHEVLLIRRIRELLYEQGFTISGARNKLDGRMAQAEKDSMAAAAEAAQNKIDLIEMRHELEQILALLTLTTLETKSASISQ